MTTTTSTASLDRIRDAVQRFDFHALLIEELGWDRINVAPLAITVGGEQFALHPVAQKRGVVVLLCDPIATVVSPATTPARS